MPAGIRLESCLRERIRSSAAKGGHIGMSYGAPQPAMPGRTIVIADGQSYSATPIAIMRGGVIAGRLLDRSGRPVTSTVVQAVQFVIIGSERRRQQTSGQTPFATTNEHGEYRVFGLLPGAYLVLANAPFSGRETEVTAEEIAWARKPEGSAPRPARPFSHASSLFPGVADVAAATPIVLARGEERLGVEFALQYAPVARVTGAVVGLDGAPMAGVAVIRSQKRRDEFLVAYSDSARTNAEGRFTMMSVGPGDHTLFVRGGRSGGPTAENSLWGLADVTVAGADVTDITIRLQQGMSLSGQIVVAGAGQDARPPDLGHLRVQLLPAIPSGALPIGLTAATEPDGKFKLEGIVPGRYRFTTTLPAAPASEPWSLRSALLSGKDVVDESFEVRPNEDINGLVVSITRARTQLSGVLTDGSGRPASELYVFVFPTNAAQWTNGSRAVRFRTSARRWVVRHRRPTGGRVLPLRLTEVDADFEARAFLSAAAGQSLDQAPAG